VEEVKGHQWKLVTVYELPVLAKLFLNVIVMEETQGNECLANSTSTNESNGCEVFSKTNDFLDQLAAFKTG
jgi:hypothetical protein